MVFTEPLPIPELFTSIVSFFGLFMMVNTSVDPIYFEYVHETGTFMPINQGRYFLKGLFVTLLGPSILFSALLVPLHGIWYYFLMIVSLITYVNIFLTTREYLSPLQTYIIFLLASLLLMIEITTIFGCFYVKDFIIPSTKLSDLELFHIIYDYFCACFNSAFEKYFVEPTVFSIKSPHFLQYKVGELFHLVFFVPACDYLARTVTPRKGNT